MPSGIERDSVVARVPQGLARPFPGVAGLTTAVLKDNKRPVWVTPRVPSDRQASRPAPGVHGDRRSR